MTKIIALDLSKRSTGWAVWEHGWERPRYGHAQLGSEFTCQGQTFVKLHQVLNEIRTLCRFESIYFEEAINPANVTGHTNIETLQVLSGLCAHARSYGYAKNCRTQAVNVTSWRRHFIGQMRRGTKSKELKEYCIERCRQYGWHPKNSDEADALGLLDYAIDLEGLIPAWRANETLRQPLLTGAAR